MAFTYTPPKTLSTFQKKMEDQSIPQWQKDLQAVQNTYQAPTTTPTLPVGGQSMITPPNAPVQPKITPVVQTTGTPPNAAPSAVLGSTEGVVTVPPIPAPTKDINLAIPQTVSSDIIAGAPTSGQVLTKAKSLAGQYQEFIAQNKAAQEASILAKTPTAQETALTQQINTLNQQAREAIAQSEESGVTGRFAAGETARISRQATIQMQGLADQLNALTAQRSVQIDALKTQMEFNKENLDAITNLSKLTQPDVISTGVDKKTGEIYSLVKDPQTGKITQNIIGKVTPEEAKLDFIKSYTDSNGNEVASFLNPENNTIVSKVLGKAEGGAGAGGFVLDASGNVVPVSSPANNWLSQFNSGLMSIEDIYTKIGSSKESIPLKNEIARLVALQGGKRVYGQDDATIQSINSQIKNVNDLLEGNKFKKISGIIQGGVGIFPDVWNVGKQDALAIAKNLTSNQTLQALADAKSKGITFGALSEKEMSVVSAAASRIAAKIKTDKDGNITGFTGSQGKFKEDLEEVKKGLEKSIVGKTQTSFATDEIAELDTAFSSSPASYFK